MDTENDALDSILPGSSSYPAPRHVGDPPEEVESVHDTTDCSNVFSGRFLFSDHIQIVNITGPVLQILIAMIYRLL